VCLFYIVDMKKYIDTKNIEWLEGFSKITSSDVSFDLYKNFTDSEENLRIFWEAFSDFYYISCNPFDKSIDEWKNMPEIYAILKRCEHMANGFPLEILIGKYSEIAMEKARKITEEKKKEFEWSGITVWDPKCYMYVVWFFGWTSWRTNQAIIKEIRDIFPDKVKVL